MKLFSQLMTVSILIGMSITSYSQVSTLGNGGGLPGDYLGWDATNPFPLEIRHNGNQPINFFTNGIQRMLINNGLGLVNNGRIAMGNNLPSGFTPRSRLHLHNTSGQTRIQFTNNNTSGGGIPTGQSGFQVGINAGGHGIIRQREQQTIRFFTGNQEIMRLTPPDNSGFNDMVTINGNNNTTLDAKLHIFDRNTQFNTPEQLFMLHTYGRGVDVFGTPYDPTTILDPINTLTDDKQFTLAYFEQSSQGVSDAGIRIKGSRTNCLRCDVAFIDFANQDPNNGNHPYTMARIGVGNSNAGFPNPSTNGHFGFMRFYTNQDDTLLERMRITQNGNVAINNTNPTEFLDVAGNGRFRVLPDSIYKADNLVNKIVMVDSTGVLRWEHTDSLNAGDDDWYVANSTNIPTSIKEDIYTEGNVGIGYVYGQNGGYSPFNASLNVFTNDTSTKNIGIYNQVSKSTVGYMAGVNTGVYGSVSGGSAVGYNALVTASSYNSYGFISGVQGGTRTNIGGRFMARTGNAAIGMQSVAMFGVNNSFGVHTNASGAPRNYGVYATVPANPPGGPFNNYADYFNGDVFTTGNYYPSETALKNNIAPISNALSTIERLQAVSYNYNTVSGLNLPSGTEYGVIAENVDTVLPELVKTITNPAIYDSLGNVVTPSFSFKGVNYTELIPVLIQGSKELIKENKAKSTLIDSLLSEVDSINNRLSILEDCILKSGLCDGGNKRTNDGKENENNTIALSNINSIILDQNVPNPFAESTKINYSIPSDVLEAKLIFYDLNGRVMQQAQILERGEGSLVVYGNNLKSGIYTYTLIADGQVIATKKMVKTK